MTPELRTDVHTGAQTYVAAGALGAELFVDPVPPEEATRSLRHAIPERP